MNGQTGGQMNGQSGIEPVVVDGGPFIYMETLNELVSSDLRVKNTLKYLDLTFVYIIDINISNSLYKCIVFDLIKTIRDLVLFWSGRSDVNSLQLNRSIEQPQQHRGQQQQQQQQRRHLFTGHGNHVISSSLSSGHCFHIEPTRLGSWHDAHFLLGVMSSLRLGSSRPGHQLHALQLRILPRPQHRCRQQQQWRQEQRRRRWCAPWSPLLPSPRIHHWRPTKPRIRSVSVATARTQLVCVPKPLGGFTFHSTISKNAERQERNFYSENGRYILYILHTPLRYFDLWIALFPGQFPTQSCKSVGIEIKSKTVHCHSIAFTHACRSIL